MILYAKYGGGHLSAAKAIYTYIEEHYLESKVEMLDCVEYVSPFISKTTTNAYKNMAKNFPWMWEKIYYGSDKGFWYKASIFEKKFLSKRLLPKFKEFMPDIIITTHPFGNQIVGYLKETKQIENVKLVTVLTDFQIQSQWLIGKEYCDYYCVSNNQMKEGLIKQNIGEDKIYVTGVPLSDKFTYGLDSDDVYRQHELKRNKKTILFFGGGEFGLGHKRTVRVLETLMNYMDKYQIVAISGKNNKMNKEFLKLYDKVKNEDLHIYKYTNQVPELMNISSLVITKPGGITSSESLASGLPLLIINPIPGQEEENAKFLEESGVAVWLKKDDDIKAILDSMLLDDNKLEQMKKNTSLVAHKNSTKDICRIVLGELYKDNF